MALYLLFEGAPGYGLFERIESEEIGDQLDEVQNRIQEFGRFNQMVKLTAFVPWTSSADALENINSVSEGVMHDKLKEFLEQNLPKVNKKKKKKKFKVGVAEEKLANSVMDGLEISCVRDKTTLELLRGIRLHFHRFLKVLKEGDIEKAQVGLAHSYSRCKVKFNINRADNHIIQAISIVDQLDKDINTFAMKAKEWYSWHFPELVQIVPDNIVYARVVSYIGAKNTLTEDKLEGLEEIVVDDDKVQQIFQAAKTSMGTDISDFDMLNISRFTNRVVKLGATRQRIRTYLDKKMLDVAPNLTTLIGEQVGARLISHAGSLTNLAKYPASTVQILGAEKALFRALKTKGNTPKYGLIFHSSYINKAKSKDKGRISRYLANKCSIASRIDSFSDNQTTAYGQKLKEQVEERLEFYNSGQAPRKNVDVMAEATKLADIDFKKEKDVNIDSDDEDEEDNNENIISTQEQSDVDMLTSTGFSDDEEDSDDEDDSDDEEEEKKKKKKDKKKKKKKGKKEKKEKKKKKKGKKRKRDSTNDEEEKKRKKKKRKSNK
eukprot:TRINITY_DN618_c0_g1_i3.p1 TRINITY_DN618_c0_g1~~TRINITY_DN618_c0_g1_i3.p1  ORF type:complete len:563 (+),score=237.52 TRINITY_DN618_c0_g1_i3:48-1691(+)